MNKILSFYLIFFLYTALGFTQIKKLGKVSISEFTTELSDLNKDVNALILFKKRNTFYEYNGSRMVIVTKIQERIKIINKEGYDFASKKINFYKKETVKIKATTFTNVNGKIIKTKLKKAVIFTEKINENWATKTFTMPNLSNGCIVEWQYTIRSPYVYSINDFIYQDDIPIKHYSAKIIFPEELNARYEYTNKHDVSIIKKDGIVITVNNIEALKEEPYVNNIENYRGKISFEITSSSFLQRESYNGAISQKTKNLTRNWKDVSTSLFKDDRFGKELKKSKYFKNELSHILNDNIKDKDKINAILSFVKNKIRWNGKFGIFTENGVSKAYKVGVGNVAEINFVLTSILRKAGLNSNPVLVSTRSHGKPVFPTRKGFNYIISSVALNNEIILLDATDPYSLPNVLPKRVLNWKGRIIRKNGSSDFIDLFSKNYSVDSKRLRVRIDVNGNINGTLTSNYKNLIGLSNRNNYNKLSNESLISRLETKYSPIEITQVKLKNKKKIKEIFSVSFTYNAENQIEIINNKMYFSPLFFLQESENYFKSDNRKFPVDFAAAWLDKFEIYIQIPKSYKIEKIPKNYTLDSESVLGNFSYTISKKENILIVKVKTKINLPIIPNNLYTELKKFYSKKIMKENEKIVLIKKS